MLLWGSKVILKMNCQISIKVHVYFIYIYMLNTCCGILSYKWIQMKNTFSSVCHLLYMYHVLKCFTMLSALITATLFSGECARKFQKYTRIYSLHNHRLLHTNFYIWLFITIQLLLFDQQRIHLNFLLISFMKRLYNTMEDLYTVCGVYASYKLRVW